MIFGWEHYIAHFMDFIHWWWWHDGIDNNYIFNNDHYIQTINELRILANVNDNEWLAKYKENINQKKKITCLSLKRNLRQIWHKFAIPIFCHK